MTLDSGYLRRVALALETLSGEPSEANSGEQGWKKRITAALEAFAAEYVPVASLGSTAEGEGAALIGTDTDSTVQADIDFLMGGVLGENTIAAAASALQAQEARDEAVEVVVDSFSFGRPEDEAFANGANNGAITVVWKDALVVDADVYEVATFDVRKFNTTAHNVILRRAALVGANYDQVADDGQPGSANNDVTVATPALSGDRTVTLATPLRINHAAGERMMEVYPNGLMHVVTTVADGDLGGYHAVAGDVTSVPVANLQVNTQLQIRFHANFTAVTGAKFTDVKTRLATAEMNTVSDLPASPALNDKILWGPTDEGAYYAGEGLWRKFDGTPLCTLFDDFEGAANTWLDDRPTTFFRYGTGSPTNLGWTRNEGGKMLLVDGSGRAEAGAINAGVGLLGPLNKALAPRGCTNCIIKVRVILDEDAFLTTASVRVSPLDDGRRAVYATLNRASLTIEEHEVGVDAAVRVLETVTFPEVDHLTTVHELTVKRVGTTITATLATNGATVSAETQYTTGRFVSLQAARPTTKVTRFMVYPLDTDAAEDVGDGVLFRGINSLAYVGDCDIGAVGTITDNGLPDILIGRSTNSTNNWAANFQQFVQESRGVFRRNEIDANADDTTTDRFTKGEGACIVTLNGVGVGKVLIDQGASGVDGGFFLYLPDDPGDVFSAHSRVQLNASVRKFGQQAIAWDIDGDGQEEIVVLYEGLGAGSAAANGGAVAYKWNGTGDPLSQGSWTEQFLFSLPGCWGAAKRSWLLDLDSDGIPESFIVGARDNRNDDGLHGVYAVEAAGFASWGAPTTLYDAGDGGDVINVTSGNFFAGDKGRSLAFCILDDPTVHFLDFTSAWAHTTVALEGDSAWNLLPLDHPAAERTPLVVVTGYKDDAVDIFGGGFYMMTGAARDLTLLLGVVYEHPADKPDAPIIRGFYDDAGSSIVIYNSGGYALQLVDFERPA